MNRLQALFVRLLAVISVFATAIGIGLFVYGWAATPFPEAAELYQRGFSSFVNQQEHSAVCRGVGAGFFVFGLMSAGLLACFLNNPSITATSASGTPLHPENRPI